MANSTLNPESKHAPASGVAITLDIAMRKHVKPSIRIVLAALLVNLGVAVCSNAEDSPAKTILVHYMPWYESKPVSGNWGWHWTMNRFNPELIQQGGQREIASHYHPLIGPYDSNDPEALECQVLLMKFSGVDGVMVDWYGTKDFSDYAMIHRNTRHLIKFIKKAGLKFAICYEDRTIRPVVNTEKVKAQDDISQAADDMAWVASEWFKDDSYVKVNDRPVLPVFGPMYFKTPGQWEQILSGLSPRPLFYALPHLSQGTGSDGAFGWPPVSGGKEIPYDTWKKYLTDLYSREGERTEAIAVVFPGYQDIYEKSYGSIGDQNGRTFDETLELAMKSPSPLIQIATWNDYGEGTVIEPTVELGYRYLEALQKNMAKQSGIRIHYEPDDLLLPVMLYGLRKQVGDNQEMQKALDGAAGLLFEQKLDQGRALLTDLKKRVGEPSAGDAPEE